MKSKLSIFIISFYCFFSLKSQIAISGYNHVGLSVEDINKSTHFYKNIIGLKPIAVPSYLKKIRSWFQIAPGQELHLLAGRKDPVNNNHSNGAHFSFSINDASKIAQYLDGANMKYIKQQRFDGAWQIYVTDPDGYVIELNEPKVNWTNLFNGTDLKNWKVVNEPKSKGQSFSIMNIEAEDVLKIDGVNSGLMVSKKEYNNYHLQLEYKWAGKNDSSNESAILYHLKVNGFSEGKAQGQELVIKENETGSYRAGEETSAKINVLLNDQGMKTYRKTGHLVEVNNTSGDNECRLSLNQEYAEGEWNILDLYCFEDQSAHMVNGKTVLVISNSIKSERGSQQKLTSGKIGFHSKGGQLLFRNIKISRLDSMPQNIVNQDNH